MDCIGPQSNLGYCFSNSLNILHMIVMKLRSKLENLYLCLPCQETIISFILYKLNILEFDKSCSEVNLKNLAS